MTASTSYKTHHNTVSYVFMTSFNHPAWRDKSTQFHSTYQKPHFTKNISVDHARSTSVRFKSMRATMGIWAPLTRGDCIRFKQNYMFRRKSLFHFLIFHKSDSPVFHYTLKWKSCSWGRRWFPDRGRFLSVCRLLNTGVCLIYEMFFIKKIKPCLNTQSDSLRAKPFIYFCHLFTYIFLHIYFTLLHAYFTLYRLVQYILSCQIYLFFIWKWWHGVIETLCTILFDCFCH